MLSKALVFVLSLSLASGLPRAQNTRRVRLASHLHNHDTTKDLETAPSKIILKSFGPVNRPLVPAASASSLYSGPRTIIEPEAAASSVSILPGYGDEAAAPSAPPSLYSAPGDLARDFDYTEVNFIGDYDIQRDDDFAASEISETAVVATDYSQPKADVISLPAASAPVVTRIVDDYSRPRASVITSQSRDEVAAGSSVSASVVKAVTQPPVAITRYENTGVNNGQYHYSYEAENGISQDVSGEMKTVNDAQVYVMKGSYSYIGTDGQTYTVDWYADETGYHPSAPHLPRSVEPNHPEVAAAVRAQMEFARQEEAAAAASTNNVVVALPDSDFNDVYAASDDLAGYGY